MVEKALLGGGQEKIRAKEVIALKEELLNKDIQICELNKQVEDLTYRIEELSYQADSLKSTIECHEIAEKEDEKWINYLEESLKREEEQTDKALKLYYNILDQNIQMMIDRVGL